MPKISVVIPVYNVEEFLSACLDSIINQTYKNLEIICIEDCSTDNSAQILKEYKQKDSRIKIIYNKENKGLSAVRNIGIDNSNGEYIYFIDSDDWIDNDYIENLVNAAVDNNAEIVVNTNVTRIFNNNEIPHLGHKTYNDLENAFIDAPTAIQNIIWNTWTHLWKRGFLERAKARFPEGELIEDIYFQIITYLQTDKIYVIRKGQYHHLYNKNGIMINFSKKQVTKQIIKILNLALDYIQEHSINTPIRTGIIPAQLRLINDENIKLETQRLFERIIKHNENIKLKYES